MVVKEAAFWHGTSRDSDLVSVSRSANETNGGVRKEKRAEVKVIQEYDGYGEEDAELALGALR